jgi:DNA-binding IclR family transcriptional regulator
VDLPFESPAAQKALDLLKRSPETYWTVSAAAAALDLALETAAEAMERLEQAGLLRRARETQAFRYSGTDGY